MSRRWEIYCRTCDKPHAFSNGNHARDLMVVLIEHAAAIAGLAPLVNDSRTYTLIEVETFHGKVDVDWFAEHAGHELVPRDEYGRL